MLNPDTRFYNYFTFGEPDEYGQPQLSEQPEGQIKMAIHVSSQSIQDNILYKGAEYVGFTFHDITDKYVIDYNGQKLKVLYITPTRAFKQVILSRMK